ncbi:DUF2007 domain-containing protein [Polaribacter sp. MSW13]|uniref:DUF2007 domain-containing protein n=1 Tax=Polaribacter marinus TaxID=2916838 RepID=A0A9X1VM81_9FLAO|nr:DUF2007 domain-containing protein [Polaribacter marinus]MCI2229074.1 DUF2007 domain-containing protein [Polaribacter marinus]
MTNEHIKVFSGSSILTNGLKSLLEEVNIACIIKDPINSGKLTGFGTLGQTIQLFILDSDLEKAKPIIEAYKEKINA